MMDDEMTEIVLVSSGHQALDHRVFDKEAQSLSRHFNRVRVVAAHPASEVRDRITISALPPCRHRLERFLMRPLQCFLAARGPGKERLLILQDAELLPWVPLVRLLTGWQVIYDVHEDFPELLLSRAWIPMPLRRPVSHAVGAMEKLYSRACDGIIGVTDVLVDYFAPRRRIAIYNLPSREFISSAAASARPLASREFDVVHLGTLCESRLAFLCEVIEALLARKADARALVLGVRPDQEQLVRERFPDDRVTVLGKVPYYRVPGYLGNCRVGLNVYPVLHPYLRCAVPVKVFEYMAAGCGIVSSHLPELHRLLGEDGAEHVMTIYGNTVERFADEVVRLLSEPATLVRHQQALMHLVAERWNWDHEAEKLVRFVAGTLQGTDVVQDEQVLE